MTTINTKTKPLIPDGWKIESHTPIGKFNLDTVVLHLEPEQEKGYLTGTTLRERLQGKKCLDASVLDYLLKHTDLIPESWKGKYVYFWGTILRDPRGDRCVLCLSWIGGEWYWRIGWLGLGFNVNGLSALLASPQNLDPQTLETKSLDSLPFDLSDLKKRVQALEAWQEKVIAAFKK